ncbi:hypothetical protein Gpo141_00009401 [Globisporangium polare]
MAAATARLSFFTRAPERPVELDEFERLGLLRLRVLCAHSAWVKGGSERELRQEVEALDAFQELFGADGEQAVDTISHYALRLAFCKTRDLIEWVVAMETKLFALRVHKLQPHKVMEILAHEGIEYEAAPNGSRHEAWAVHPPPASSSGSSPTVKSESLVYKVPFHEAARLIKRRRVLLKKGICFVPAHSMHVVAEHHFRVSLEQQLKILQRALPANTEVSHSFDRLEPILDRFIAQSRLQMGGGDPFSQRRRTEQSQITAENIDAMAEKHFPLCMRNLHRKFRENHHLKYDGRIQYHRFLKGVGWSVQNTLLFFRNEFTRVMPIVKFDKEHAYSIRHSYGLEGGRVDYTPASCQELIVRGSAPRKGQYHGCPFRHWDAAQLTAELQGRSGLSSANALEIATRAASGDCQGACQQHFDTSHPRMYAQAAHQYSSPNSHGRREQHRLAGVVRHTASLKRRAKTSLVNQHEMKKQKLKLESLKLALELGIITQEECLERRRRVAEQGTR